MDGLPISVEEYRSRCWAAVTTQESKRPLVEAVADRLWNIGPPNSPYAIARELQISHVTAGKWLKSLKKNGLYFDKAVKLVLQDVSQGKPAKGDPGSLQEIIDRISAEAPEEAQVRYAALLEQQLEAGVNPRDLSSIINAILNVRPNVKVPEKTVSIQMLVGKESIQEAEDNFVDDVLWLAENRQALLKSDRGARLREALLMAIPEAEIEASDERTVDPDRVASQAGGTGLHTTPGSASNARSAGVRDADDSLQVRDEGHHDEVRPEGTT